MEKFVSNSGKEFVILSKQGKKCIIQFTETGTTRTALYDNLVKGKVRDYYAKTSYGVGYPGEFKKVSYWKQANQLWRNMLKRCYFQKDPRGYFGEAFVDARWLCFANFLEDLPKLQNFDAWLKGQNGDAQKYNLDKDRICKGNKVYSRETCQFLTEFENKSDGGKNRQAIAKTKKSGQQLTPVV